MKFQNKIIIILTLVTTLIFIIIGRLFFLQIISHHKYKYQAQNNIKKTIHLPAYRGEIFIDKGKKKIAYNTPSYSIYLVPQSFPFNIYLDRKKGKKKEEKRKRYQEYLAKIEREFNISSKKIDFILKKKEEFFINFSY